MLAINKSVIILFLCFMIAYSYCMTKYKPTLPINIMGLVKLHYAKGFGCLYRAHAIADGRPDAILCGDFF